MSDTDSFIDEVTEEVRRDRLYGYVRRYGWIAAALVVLIVGGAAFSEYRKAQTQAAAQDLGDAILAAYQNDDQNARAQALTAISSDNPSARAALDLIAAAELGANGQNEDAAQRLNALAENGDVPEVYRHIAGFKALLAQSDSLDAATRRSAFEQFAVPGNPMRVLAQEQLALIAVETGDRDGAIETLQALTMDAEASSGLQQRALQVIVSLGEEPRLATPATQQN
ncbi:MAG: hypothetical protein AB8B71_11985 [Paracoccaceae bacterium]